MELDIKTVSFGGYDKKATETYIAEKSKAYEDEIAKLKEDATKLSEAVKGLQQMREANMSESKSTIDHLEAVNEGLQSEIEKLKVDLEDYKKREIESASRYESISRTLLSATESAEALTQKTNAECETKKLETEAWCKAQIEETTNKCDTLEADTNYRCEQLKNATEAECDRLLSETQSSCQEKKETVYAECESLKRKTREETDALSRETQERCENLKFQTESACERLKSETQAECERQRNETQEECDKQKAATREEIRSNRALVKKEFDSIGNYMAQLKDALSLVNEAVDETQKITESTFNDNLDAASDDATV